MDYRVLSPDRVVVLQHRGMPQGKDFPYKHYPISFERQPVELDLLKDIPKATKKAIRDCDPTDRIRSSTKKSIEKWLGHSVKFGFDIWWHQFGGQPWLIQGPERIICANKKCPWHRRKWAMKILASIINDPPGGLPMLETMEHVNEHRGHFNHYVQVVFHICGGCLSIHAANRCD